MLKLENPVISHPSHGHIKFVPNNTQRLIFSYFLDLQDENIVFLCERQSGTSIAAAALAVYLAKDKPGQNIGIVSHRLDSQKQMNKKVTNLSGPFAQNSTYKTINFKNESSVHFFNSMAGECQFRGHRFDTIFLDNSVPIPGYIPTQKRIYFITEESDRNQCWFNFAKLPKGDYKLIKI